VRTSLRVRLAYVPDAGVGETDVGSLAFLSRDTHIIDQVGIAPARPFWSRLAPASFEMMTVVVFACRLVVSSSKAASSFVPYSVALSVVVSDTVSIVARLSWPAVSRHFCFLESGSPQAWAALA
jgi:hypothetical protein